MINFFTRGEQSFEWGDAIAETEDYTMYKWYTYGGVKYSTYDSVFTLSRGVKNSDVGKITMIWETIRKERRVKVLWFLRPGDISNFLGDYRPNYNELFMASGQGKGLSDVIPLEAILGKCNVICTSKDPKNIPPSKSAVKAADFIFSHVFDVDTRVLSSKLPGTIGPVKVERLLNEVAKPKVSVEGQRGVSPLIRDAQKLLDQFTSENQPLKRRRILENEIDGVEEADLGDGIPPLKLKKPAAAEENWLVKSTWEEKILAAHERGRLVTLTNLDPSCTSSQVQEMILFAFELKVEARIQPRIPSSSPLHAQAFVVFNSVDEANFVVSRLTKHCLVDGEGRPFVAFKTTIPELPKSKFPGHFALEMHEMKKRTTKDKTMSACHSAQAHTLEFPMATEWILLQERCDRWYQALHKKQEKEIAACMNKVKIRESNVCAAAREQ